MTQQAQKPARNGELQIVMGIGHILVGLRTYATVLKAMKHDGVFNSIKGDHQRAAAFWYLFVGCVSISNGFLVRSLLRKNETLPASMGWSMLALSTTGAAILPRSGFWLGIALALLHLRTASHGQAPANKLPAEA